MCGGHPHHIPGTVNTGRQMCRAGIVIDAPVGIVTEDCHVFRRLSHIMVAALILDLQGIQVFTELVIRHQGREHRHQNRSAVLPVVADGVGFNCFRVLVVDTGKHGTPDRVVDSQVVYLRAGGGLVLRDAFGATEADCAR